MRILCVCENYWPLVGGAEHALERICEGLAERGHSVTVITHQAHKTLRRELKNGVEIVRVPCLGNRYLFTLLAIPTIVRFALSADVIQTVTFNAAPASWLASRLTGRPVCVTVWETWLGNWRKFTNFSYVKALFHELLERAVLALPYDRYLAISQSTATRLREVLPQRRPQIATVYLGFDPQPWKVKHDRASTRASLDAGGAFLIVGYGRPGASKGFRHVIEAAPRILKSIPNAKILLVLSEAAQYRSELQRLKRIAPSHVCFLASKPLEQLVRIVQAADCIVVPSLAEGFGYVVLEAAAAGTPMVASRTTSIPEVIGGSYRWSTPGDAHSIADEVIALAHGQVVREAERTFPWSRTVESYEREYEIMCGSNCDNKETLTHVVRS